jgi:hypothetical protein
MVLAVAGLLELILDVRTFIQRLFALERSR